MSFLIERAALGKLVVRVIWSLTTPGLIIVITNGGLARGGGKVWWLDAQPNYQMLSSRGKLRDSQPPATPRLISFLFRWLVIAIWAPRIEARDYFAGRYEVNLEGIIETLGFNFEDRAGCFEIGGSSLTFGLISVILNESLYLVTLDCEKILVIDKLKEIG